MSGGGYIKNGGEVGGGGGFANPMTTAGDIIIGGALGTPTRLAVGAEGSIQTVVSGVPAWAAGPVTTDDFTSAVPWTAVNGNGTAAVSGGVGSCSVAPGVTASAPNRPSLSRALPTYAPWQVLDVSARLASFTGTLGTARALFNISTAPDGANDTYTGAATDFGVSALVLADGSLTVGDYNGGGGVFNSRLTTSAGVVPLDSSGFLRVIARPDSYTVLTGVGATYAAAVWTPRHTQGVVWAARALATVSLSGYRNDSQAEAHTVTWDDLVMVAS